MSMRWLKWMIEPPPVVDVLAKITAFLALAWATHFALRRANPRWRVLLWRWVASGLIVIPILKVSLPSWRVTIAPPEAAPISRLLPGEKTAEPVALVPSFVTHESAAYRGPDQPTAAAPARPARRSPFSFPAWVKAHAASICLGAWIATASALLARFCIGLRRVRRMVKSTAPAHDSLRRACAEIANELGIARSVEIRLSGEISSPFLTGLRGPLLILPSYMAEPVYCRELRGILAHELSHLRSNDLLWGYILHLVSVLAWFHPLVWRMRAAHASACEEVSDAITASFLGDAKAYSRTLARVALDMACRPPLIGGIPMARVSEISRRLSVLRRRVFSAPPGRVRVAVFFLSASLATALLSNLRLAYTKNSEAPARGAEPKAAEVAAPPTAAQDSGPTQKEPAKARGRIRGVVVNADTGKPVTGAQVAVGRHLEEDDVKRIRETGVEGGLQTTAQTDQQGRFVLEGVAFWDYHLFSVKRSGFVPHEEWVALTKEEPEAEVRVSLKTSAAITVRVMDAEGLPMLGQVVRVESKEGHALLPARGDWRPDLPYRTETTKWGMCSFGGLDAGVFSIEAIQMGVSETTYHGGISDVVVKAGETKEVELKPAKHRSVLNVKTDKDPHTKEGWWPLLVISRNPGLLAWAGRNFYHPEDERLARVMRYTLNSVASDSFNTSRWGALGFSDTPYTFRNFPPGSYALLAISWGEYKFGDRKLEAAYIRGVEAELPPGKEQTVTIPWGEPEGPSPTIARTFGSLVAVESKEYSAEGICQLLMNCEPLMKRLGDGGKILADSSVEGQKLALSRGEISIWDLLEKAYLEKGWRLEADHKSEALVLRAGSSRNP